MTQPRDVPPSDSDKTPLPARRQPGHGPGRPRQGFAFLRLWPYLQVSLLSRVPELGLQ